MSHKETELSRKHSLLMGLEVKELPPKKEETFKLSGDGLFVDENKTEEEDKDADKSKKTEEKKDEEKDLKKDEEKD